VVIGGFEGRRLRRRLGWAARRMPLIIDDRENHAADARFDARTCLARDGAQAEAQTRQWLA